MNTITFRPVRQWIFLVASVALLAFAVTVRAAIPPAEQLLPSDTLFVVTAPDSAAMRAAMNQSPQWLLWNDEAMKPFHDKFMGKFNESFVAPLERDLGVKLADFTGLPQGQFTFAVTQNGWNGIDDEKTPGILLLLDAKDKGDLLKTNLATLQKKWTDAGKSIRTETVREIPFSIVTLASNDIPPSLAKFFPKRQTVSEIGKVQKPVTPSQLVVGQFESLLIAGDSIKAVESVAMRLTGGALPPLDDNPIFAADKAAQFRDAPLYYGWFNAKTVFDVLSHIPTTPPNPDIPTFMPAIPWDKILAASGLTGLKSATFTYRESREGAQVDFFVSVPETSRTGILKMIANVPKDANPPVFVPADAVKFWRWRVDGRKAWTTLQKMVEDINPDWLDKFNSAIDFANMMTQQKDPSFDIRKSLLSNFGDDFISFQKVPAGDNSAGLDSAPSLFLFAAANADEAALAVKNIMSLRSAQPDVDATRDFHGKKIYTITLPDRRLPGTAAPVPHSLYCAASSGYVALTDDISMMENYLRNAENPVKPLSETSGLTEAAQHTGGAGSGLFGYENQREVMRSAFKALKQQTDAGGKGGISSMALFPKEFLDWADFSLLPDYDKVSKYFFFSVYSGSATVDGLSVKIFAPRPSQTGQ